VMEEVVTSTERETQLTAVKVFTNTISAYSLSCLRFRLYDLFCQGKSFIFANPFRFVFLWPIGLHFRSTYVCVYACMYVCMYVCTYVRSMYVCMCVCS
jgi:hypothetical protein